MLIDDEAHMLAIAEKMAKRCHPPLVVYLSGELGAGKTTFARGFLKGLGYDGKVKSPSYTLVETYHFENFDVFHFDFYRIHDAHELELIGIRDYFHKRSLCLIEWPEQGGDFIPAPDILCAFTIEDNRRRIEFSTRSIQGDRIMQKFKVNT